MKDINFGWPARVPWSGDVGSLAALAMNSSNCLALWLNPTTSTVYGALGSLESHYGPPFDITWSSMNQSLGTGQNPPPPNPASLGLAMNNSNNVVALMQFPGSYAPTFYYGQLSSTVVTWLQKNGSVPSPAISPRSVPTNVAVAMNNANPANVIVAYSAGGASLFYCLGSVRGNQSIAWNSSSAISYGSGGSNCTVALNDAGYVVEVHLSGGQLYAMAGQISNNTVSWLNGGGLQLLGGFTLPSGARLIAPSVSMTQDGFVMVTFGYVTIQPRGPAPSLYTTTQYSAVGNLSWPHFTWLREASVDYSYEASLVGDYGTYPTAESIASNGNMAAQLVCNNSIGVTSDSPTTLSYSCCLITDRSQWMSTLLQNDPFFSNLTLNHISLPMTHDAGMYQPGGAGGQTQLQTISQQLQGGVRCFDLRVTESDDGLRIHHGPNNGPLFADVLNDLQQFMSQPGCQEFVLLLFSALVQYETIIIDSTPMSQSSFDNTFVPAVRNALGPCLLTQRPSTRLAATPISQFKGKALVFVDADYVVGNNAQPGFYVYRDLDWACRHPSNAGGAGDLCVGGSYANTTDYEMMKKDQTDKFTGFTGACKDSSGVPSPQADLFQTSWTLTPVFNVVGYSGKCNPNLVSAATTWLGGGLDPSHPVTVVSMPKNTHGWYLNLISLDNYQTSRVTDLCIALNRSYE